VSIKRAKRRPPARLRKAVAKYRWARRALREPISTRSKLGLDWLNFFVSDVQTSFGSFVAYYLASLHWSRQDVGLALTVGGLAAVASLVPGGALADLVRDKRVLAGCGIIMLAGAALILALAPRFPLVFLAEILQGATAGVLAPSISAISLGLAGRRAMSSRTGRNQRFRAAGTAVTAGLMGLVATKIAVSAIFLATAGFCIPALVALFLIRPEEIDYRRARNAEGSNGARDPARILELCKNRKLLIFAVCLILFQLANASMLPMVGEDLAASYAGTGPIYMAGLVVVPQIIVAILSPWVGYYSEKRGRKALLLIAFGVEVARALLFAFVSTYPILLLAQVLDGISGATVTVLTILVIMDLTTGTGRFNLALGLVGMLTAMAAAASTAASGFLFESLGNAVGFLAIAIVAGIATVCLWFFLPETKPAKYSD
jgi:predicted MFS family arabinose efflux permease